MTNMTNSYDAYVEEMAHDKRMIDSMFAFYRREAEDALEDLEWARSWERRRMIPPIDVNVFERVAAKRVSDQIGYASK